MWVKVLAYPHACGMPWWEKELGPAVRTLDLDLWDLRWGPCSTGAWDKLLGAWSNHALGRCWVSSGQHSTSVVPVPLQWNWFCTLVRKMLCHAERRSLPLFVTMHPQLVRVSCYRSSQDPTRNGDTDGVWSISFCAPKVPDVPGGKIITS